MEQKSLGATYMGRLLGANALAKLLPGEVRER
jgi:hypothetical protein